MEKMLTLQCTLFLLIASGILVRRLGLVSEQGQKNLTDLVIYLVLPCNILRAFLSSDVEGLFSSFLGILLIAAGIQIFCLIYARILYRNETDGRKTCLQYAIVCSNAGFIGNPVAEGIYGAEGLLLASIYLIPLRIMMWSAGIAMFSGTKDIKATIKRVLTHPCIIATVVGIIFMFAGWKLPAGLMGAVTSISSCNTTLSMMVVGMILYQVRLKELLDRTALIFSFHRLILIPLIVFLICRLLPVSRMVTGISVLLSGMPAGATTSILASKYNKGPVFATKLVVVSTLLSIPCIAFWSFLLGL